MIIYFLKMIACTGILYAFYFLFLRNEKMLVFNRFYLLGALVCSFFIPLIVITLKESNEVYRFYAVAENHADTSLWSKIISVLPYCTAFILFTGSIFMTVRFVKNLLKINRLINTSEMVNLDSANIILLPYNIVPHSFLNNIFVSKQAYSSAVIEQQILQHELAHVHQKHSWDVILVEILQIFTWFNPMLYLYKRSLRINHELLADDAVIKTFNDVQVYEKVLIRWAGGGGNTLAITSSFNFLITKTRLIMLRKQFSLSKSLAKGLMIIPLMGLLIFIFAERVSAQAKEAKQNSILPQNIKRLTIKDNNGVKKATLEYIDGKVVTENISSPELASAFEKKYGVDLTPPSPPPPPPSPENVGNLPKDVESIQYRMINNRREARVKYKDGSEKNIPIETDDELEAFYKKYNETPPPPPPPPSRKEHKGFTAPKIQEDTQVRTREVTITDASNKEGKDGDVKITEITLEKIDDNKTKANSRKQNTQKRFAPPKVVKDEEVKTFTPPKIVKD